MLLCLALASSSLPAPNARAALPPAKFQTEVIATFAAPWAMAFLPDGRLLVSERPPGEEAAGALSLLAASGSRTVPVTGLPANIGILDVAPAPQSARPRVFFSFLEPGNAADPRIGAGSGDKTRKPYGLALATAILSSDGDAGQQALREVRVIWRQTPKIVSEAGTGEPGGRIAFAPDGRHLFLTAGDRQQMDRAQDLGTTLGKIVRLNLDGSIPRDNPFVGTPGARGEIWTFGHRNPYGLAFDRQGKLWSHEMGPMGGDELNLVRRGANYGWPRVSNGNHYTGDDVPDHRVWDGFQAPVLSWTPAVSPSNMLFYSGTKFSGWRGDVLISGLQYTGLIRVRYRAGDAVEVQRIPLGKRIRDVRQARDGAIWVMQDGPDGKLLRLTPAS